MEKLLLLVSEWAGAVAVAMIAGTSTKFQRTKLVFKYPRREGIVALGVFGFALLVAVILISIKSFSLAGLSSEMSYRLFVAVGGLVPVVVALIRRKQPVRSAGWARDKLNPSIQLGLALAFLSIFLRGKFSAVVSGLNSASLGMLAFSLVVSLLEETAFRGYIQQRLAAWWGSNPGWLAAAGLYLIWQLPRLLGSAPEQLWLNLGITAAQSLVAGFIMQRSNHVLAPALYLACSNWLFTLQ